MRAMKDSGVEWIGCVPNQWDIMPLSRLFEERKHQNIGNVVNNVLSLSYGNIVRRNVTDNMGLLPESFETYNIIEPGNIVLRLTDLQNDQRSPRTGLVKERGIITSAYMTLAKKEDIDSRYYYYLFCVYDAAKVIYNMSNGVRKNLRYTDVSKSPVLLPDIMDQRRIADFLDGKCSKIEAIIEKQQQTIEKLKSYKQSTITEVISKGLDQTVHQKESGASWVKKIPATWNISKLSYFADCIGDGLHGTPVFNEDGEFFFVNGNNLGNRRIEIKSNTRRINREEFEKYRVTLPDRTLLISLNGKIGNLSRYCGEHIVLGKSVGYIILAKDLNIDYIWYYLQSGLVSYLYKILFSETTVKNLSLEALRRLPVFSLPLTDQQQIVNYLDARCRAISEVISKKCDLITKLKEYKMSLIYEAVTGKMKV